MIPSVLPLSAYIRSGDLNIESASLGGRDIAAYVWEQLAHTSRDLYARRLYFTASELDFTTSRKGLGNAVRCGDSQLSIPFMLYKEREL